MKKFHIVIGCDCDPDRKGFSRKINNKDLFWDGIEIGIRNFSRSRKIFADKTGYFLLIFLYVSIVMLILLFFKILTNFEI